jgi:hypothetical protein
MRLDGLFERSESERPRAVSEAQPNGSVGVEALKGVTP